MDLLVFAVTGVGLGIVAGGLWYVIGQWIVRRASDSTTAMEGVRRWITYGEFCGGLSAMVMFFWGVFGDVSGGPGSIEVLPESFGTSLDLGLLFLFGLLPIASTKIALLPAIDQVRNKDKSVSAEFRDLIQHYAIAGMPIVGSVMIATVSFHYWGLAAAAMIGIWIYQFVMWIGKPWMSGRLRTVRPPTRTESERLADLCASVDLRVDSYLVVENSDGTIGFDVQGSPLYRALVIAAPTLEMDSEALRAVLAQQAGLVRQRYRVLRLIAFSVFLVPIAGIMIASSQAHDPLGLLFSGALVVGYWVASRGLRKRVYAAFEYAVEITSSEAVIEAYEQVSHVNDIDGSQSRWRTVLYAEPPLEAVLDRLRERQE
ncbi:hypothetical protein Huta_0385 [Halorhabdus utahensis DSM 12940]|uniref:Peptidase n=2 Tax=Halorhabdus utahensis TaxID=146826 RepID=C7NRD5_HALUD|nr:hypothetical protein Huta_0385 [Halorhabdus utahensis DSM 12940]